MVYQGVFAMMYPCMCLDVVVLQWSTLCSGVSGLSRRTCLKRACRLRAVTDMMLSKPVREDTLALVT